MSQGLSSLVESARMQTQNELLQAHGSELEKALAARNDELSRMLATLQQEVAVRRPPRPPWKARGNSWSGWSRSGRPSSASLTTP